MARKTEDRYDIRLLKAKYSPMDMDDVNPDDKFDEIPSIIKKWDEMEMSCVFDKPWGFPLRKKRRLTKIDLTIPIGTITDVTISAGGILVRVRPDNSLPVVKTMELLDCLRTPNGVMRLREFYDVGARRYTKKKGIRELIDFVHSDNPEERVEEYVRNKIANRTLSQD